MTNVPRRIGAGRAWTLAAGLVAFVAVGLCPRRDADVDRGAVEAGLRGITWGDPAARRRAADELGRARTPDPRRIFAALVGATTGDADPGVRAAAARALGLALALANSIRRGPEVPIVGRDEPEAAAVRVMVGAMVDADAGVRRAAVEAFGRLQVSVRIERSLLVAAVPTFERLLGDAEPATRRAATWGLGRLPAPPAEARARLLAVLDGDPDRAVRVVAIRALVLGWPAPELYRVLLDRLARAPTAEERATICWSLASLPPPPPAVLPALVDLMAGDEVAAQVVPGVLLEARDEDRAGLLGLLGPVVGRELAEPRSPLRAASLVATIAPDSPEARGMLGPLARRLRDPADDGQRQVAARVLAAYRGSAAPLVPSLRDLLRCGDPAARHCAAHLLGEIGRPALVAIDELAALQRTDDDAGLDATLRKLRRLAAR